MARRRLAGKCCDLPTPTRGAPRKRPLVQTIRTDCLRLPGSIVTRSSLYVSRSQTQLISATHVKLTRQAPLSLTVSAAAVHVDAELSSLPDNGCQIPMPQLGWPGQLGLATRATVCPVQCLQDNPGCAEADGDDCSPGSIYAVCPNLTFSPPHNLSVCHRRWRLSAAGNALHRRAHLPLPRDRPHSHFAELRGRPQWRTHATSTSSWNNQNGSLPSVMWLSERGTLRAA